MKKEKNGALIGRRDFLKTAALAAVGSAIPYAKLQAKDKAIKPKPEPGKSRGKKNLLLLNGSSNSQLIKTIETDPEIGFKVNQIQVNYNDPPNLLKAIQGNDAGILLACLPSMTFSFGRLAQHMGDVDIPMILYSPNKDLLMIDANLAAELRAKGASVKLATSDAEVIEFLKMAASPGIIGDKKALIFGKPFESTSVPAHNLTEEYVYEHTGVSIQYQPLEELKSLLKKIDKTDAEEEMERWRKEAEKADSISSRAFLDECRIYILLRSIIEKENLSAVSIDCLNYSFNSSPMLPLPCLAFARLRDEGITASCEADVCGLLSSMVFERIGGRSSYFANVASVNAQKSTVVLRHCVAPLRMFGYKSPQLPYELHSYHGLGTGLVPTVKFPVDTEVTMGAYTKDLKGFVVWPGKSRTGRDDTDEPFSFNSGMRKYCSNRIEVEIRDFDRFYQNIAGLHNIMVAGNFVKEIAEAMSAENVKVIGPLDTGIS